MARSVGDVLVGMLGKAQLDLAQMTARAEAAEEAMQKMLDAAKAADAADAAKTDRKQP